MAERHSTIVRVPQNRHAHGPGHGLLADEQLIALIRAKIISGALPTSRPDIAWPGYGSNRVCSACERTILTHETEWEIDVPGRSTFRFHQRCLDAWERDPRMTKGSDRTATNLVGALRAR